MFPQIILRQQLAWLRARYDDGAIPPGIYRTIKTIEVELSWHDHRAKQARQSALERRTSLKVRRSS
jgi:hypothetical protein